MILNRLEKSLMNSPLRWATQRFVDVRLFLAMGGRLPPGAEALEMGCGKGRGMGMIMAHFGADRVDGFDLDPEMVALARESQQRHHPANRVWVGDATAMAVADGRYQAVFDFGIIHHVPDWRRALAEAHRVLAPGGTFYLFEVYAAFICHPLWRRLMDHPQADRFDHHAMGAALARQGFRIVGERQRANQFGWYVARKAG